MELLVTAVTDILARLLAAANTQQWSLRSHQT